MKQQRAQRAYSRLHTMHPTHLLHYKISTILYLLSDSLLKWVIAFFNFQFMAKP